MNQHLEDTAGFLERLVSYPTVSADSNRLMVADLAARLEDAGARVELFETGDGKKANLFATLGPDVHGGIVLSGHTDVVPVADQDWCSDPFEMRKADGNLFGRGTCDMKGFIAAATVLAPEFAKQPLRRPIHYAFTYDEEVGCLGARALVPILQERGIRPAMAIIGEPTDMRVIEGHKGCCEYTVNFTGLEGHGSSPHRGVNAAEYAVRYVTELMRLRGELMMRAPEGGRFEPPWTTINVGRIAGGVAHNVIAGKAEVEWEMRPVQNGDAEFVKSAMQSVIDRDLLPMMRAVSPSADIVTDVIGEVSGLEVMEENAARDLVASLLGANGADVVAFGTEAGLFQQMGMSVTVCGPGSIDLAHKPDEYVSMEQLGTCLDMLERLGRSSALLDGSD
ncbi:acetylornithine deacetylase [Sedimentitalea todarodis]|uniref:Acetylornithine deacetylase n=1 Tax=Sedimentitalea todarodis TaxID=1631240 RepID=A0ABU3VET5_9RHOB|nr:acetylornithine deacetylase [Sedimentitalea todarodis]MDU9004229.1 acetylornithine deacetylase [Sedimentitalea todarodis]